MNFDDPFIRRISQTVLAILTIAMFSIGGLTSWLVLDWDGQINHSAGLVTAIGALPLLSGERTNNVQNLTAILLSALPLMVAPICFSIGEAGLRRLNKFGATMTIVLIVALVLSTFGYVGMDPDKWKDGHQLGLDGLQHAQQWARTVISGCVFYLAALLGIKATR